MSTRPVRPWQLAVTLDPGADQPVFVQIAQAVAADIRRGRLRPGDPLPGSRALAEALGVHRNTVLAAFRELTAEGWIASERARGTFVSHTLPEPKTPMWLPALGATLFLMAGVWWAYTSSSQHETETEQAKPAASAHP